MSLCIKIHKTIEGRKLVAICDSELLGKKFEEGKLQLDLTSQFYSGEITNQDEILNIISNAQILNIVGEKSIEFCLKNKFIVKENIIYIDNIPHAQAILSGEE
jgi:uncharacterized protein